MTTTTTPVDIQALQTRERIAVAAAAAMFVAGVVLMTAILPAEYGVDPLGTGKLLGLTQIAGAAPDAAVAAAGGPTSLEPVRPDANVPQQGRFQRDSKSFELGPLESVEYKYQMEKGGSLVYAWTATGKVKSEFHGEPEGAPRGYAEFYEKIDASAANGSFFAPTPGIHGWYWENLGSDPVTVTLTSAGFYSAGIRFSSAGREELPLGD